MMLYVNRSLPLETPAVNVIDCPWSMRVLESERVGAEGGT